MNVVNRGLVGIGVVAGVAAGVNMAEHYNVDEHAAEHAVQKCAIQLDIPRQLGSTVYQACTGYNTFSPQTVITNHRTSIVNTQTFLGQEQPIAQDKDRSDDRQRQNEEYCGYIISVLAGAAVYRTIRPDGNRVKSKKDAKVPVSTVSA